MTTVVVNYMESEYPNKEELISYGASKRPYFYFIKSKKYLLTVIIGLKL